MIFLDTNVISELAKTARDPAVVAFLRRQPHDTVFIPAICEAEIRYGLARLPAGRRRDTLTATMAAFFANGFAGRILPFDSVCAAFYGELHAARDAAGRPISVADAMIAATARAHGAAVATRNVTDFAGCGIAVVNPWQPI